MVSMAHSGLILSCPDGERLSAPSIQLRIAMPPTPASISSTFDGISRFSSASMCASFCRSSDVTLPSDRIKSSLDLAVTLCVGERSREEYRIWKEAGADRYLLKIETSDPDLYTQLHPGMSFENRRRCLQDLRDLGMVPEGVELPADGHVHAPFVMAVVDGPEGGDRLNHVTE